MESPLRTSAPSAVESVPLPAANLVVEGIRKRFGTHAVLSQVTLTVESGEFVTLLGPSGCGKTTLLRIIAGLDAGARAETVGLPAAGERRNPV